MQGESKKTQSGAYRFGSFELHPSERQLYSKNERVALTPKAFDALLLLVANAERLVRKDELIHALWPDTFVEEANLTNIIVTLRKILGRTAIETVWKFGYRFSLPVIGEPGIDPDIYATFVHAKQTFAVRSVESAASARDLFALCVTKDPTFAAAWAWLGRCYRFLEKFGVNPSVNVDLARAAFERALAIDPHLAAAHQFYTQLQADMGQAQAAMMRLATRIAQRGEEAESYAALVQVLRFCGLLEESVAAHERAIRLDPSVPSSVTHTFFLLGNFQATLATYPAVKGYLDLAALAGLGETDRARSLLRERLQSPAQSPLTAAMLDTLLSALESRGDDVVRVIRNTDLGRDPESHFYLARHCGMVAAADEAIRLVADARQRGFMCSYALRHHAAFAPIRHLPQFRSEIDHAVALEDVSRRSFASVGIVARP